MFVLSGCGIKFGSISTTILNNQNQTVTLEVSGINENSAVICVLVPSEDSRNNISLITSKPQRKEINKDDFVYAIFYTNCVPGQYSLVCSIDGTKIQFNETVYVYDYNSFQITSVYPNSVTLNDSPSDRKVDLATALWDMGPKVTGQLSLVPISGQNIRYLSHGSCQRFVLPGRY